MLVASLDNLSRVDSKELKNQAFVVLVVCTSRGQGWTLPMIVVHAVSLSVDNFTLRVASKRILVFWSQVDFANFQAIAAHLWADRDGTSPFSFRTTVRWTRQQRQVLATVSGGQDTRVRGVFQSCCIRHQEFGRRIDFQRVPTRVLGTLRWFLGCRQTCAVERFSLRDCTAWDVVACFSLQDCSAWDVLACLFVRGSTAWDVFKCCVSFVGRSSALIVTSLSASLASKPCGLGTLSNIQVALDVPFQ